MLPPEIEEGNYEYKRYISSLTKERFNELSTQMNWRLNEGNGFCFRQAYAGQSKISENTDIDNWGSWYETPWHFNIKMEGEK